MNQERIGKFIATLRKEKNMTQIELANKLGITDRAISKWENGRGMPDLSLIKPLCDEMGITINELLSGEKIKKQDYQEKFEENVLNTIDYSNKKIKKAKRISTIIFGTISICIIAVVTLFFIDVKRMNNNQPVLFSTWRYSYYPPIDLHEEEIENAIIEYLNNKNENAQKHYDNEKCFSSIQIYLIEEIKSKSFYNIYAWVLEENHYLKDNEIKKDSASSISYKFVVANDNGTYKVTDSRIPRDGNQYNKDMESIFPSSVRKNMENVHSDGTIDRLGLDIEKQIKLYFNQ